MKQLSRLFREGEPKWSFIPDRQKYIAELFYQFTQTASAGDLDRFMSSRHALRHGHHALPRLLARHHHERDQQREGVGRGASNEGVTFLLAGGLFGVLAAVNEAVEDSYWTTLGPGDDRGVDLPLLHVRLARRRPCS